MQWRCGTKVSVRTMVVTRVAGRCKEATVGRDGQCTGRVESSRHNAVVVGVSTRVLALICKGIRERATSVCERVDPSTNTPTIGGGDASE